MNVLISALLWMPPSRLSDRCRRITTTKSTKKLPPKYECIATFSTEKCTITLCRRRGDWHPWCLIIIIQSNREIQIASSCMRSMMAPNGHGYSDPADYAIEQTQSLWSRLCCAKKQRRISHNFGRSGLIQFAETVAFLNSGGRRNCDDIHARWLTYDFWEN